MQNPDYKLEPWVLKQRQGLPLDIKVKMTQRRIKQWYERHDGRVYVSFSGGKDSTVLLHLVRQMYPEVQAAFIDTGLEYPEIRDFVKTIENVEWLKPKLGFKAVIEKYGYPVVSKEVAQKIHEIRTTKSDKLRNKRLHGDDKGNGKVSEKWKILIDAPFNTSHKCCDALKKSPVKKYERVSGLRPFVGTMAEDSWARSLSYLRKGCNSFDTKRPMSTPLMFWRESDIWEYLKLNGLMYSKIYDMGYTRTGCMFCMFGAHLEPEPNKFVVMAKTHPAQWNYCINKLGCGQVLDFIGVEYE